MPLSKPDLKYYLYVTNLEYLKHIVRSKLVSSPIVPKKKSVLNFYQGCMLLLPAEVCLSGQSVF